ncbi:hypothetical protein [Allokutzneria oryzae]|uniref:Uncharacterized protein n=1 Tax=Allokutzneria oryzae TaxID=1378989 RepID=A0ABV5ZT39_9PSEU
MAFDDDDETEDKDIRFDRDHPLNTSATVNGLRIAIYVSITDLENTSTFCTKTIYFAHPG